ncbi:unnamed protein product, partial [Prorocentrum cordatum]
APRAAAAAPACGGSPCGGAPSEGATEDWTAEDPLLACPASPGDASEVLEDDGGRLYDEGWWHQHLEERRHGGAPPDAAYMRSLAPPTTSGLAAAPLGMGAVLAAAPTRHPPETCTGLTPRMAWRAS